MFSPLEVLLEQIHLTLLWHLQGGKWGFQTRPEQQKALLWGVERSHLHSVYSKIMTEQDQAL